MFLSSHLSDRLTMIMAPPMITSYTQLPHPRPHLPSLAPFSMAELDPDFLFPPVILTSMKSQARLKGSELPSRVTFYLLNAKKH